MATETIRNFDDVVMVRWRQLSPGAVDRVVALTEEVHRQHGLVTFMGLIGNESDVPSEPVRQALMSATEGMLGRCRSMNLIFDGQGLRFVAARSAAAAMFLLKGDRRMRMYNGLYDALVDRVPGRAEALLQLSRAEGLLPRLATSA